MIGHWWFSQESFRNPGLRLLDLSFYLFKLHSETDLIGRGLLKVILGIFEPRVEGFSVGLIGDFRREPHQSFYRCPEMIVSPLHHLLHFISKIGRAHV